MSCFSTVPAGAKCCWKEEEGSMGHPPPILSYQARREVLLHLAPRYQNASRAHKSLFLDEFIKVTGYTRKHAIGLLNHTEEKKKTIHRHRLPSYGPNVQHALFLAWKAARYICATRLIPFLPDLIALLEQQGHLHLTQENRHQLLSMSTSTAGRFLRTQRKPTLHGLCTTKAGSLLKQQIPIRTFSEWDEAQPGFLEIDLVAHCGPTLEGSFLYTLTMTDVATGWTECLPYPIVHQRPSWQPCSMRTRSFPFHFWGSMSIMETSSSTKPSPAIAPMSRSPSQGDAPMRSGINASLNRRMG
jgi:hypothetical protein